MNDTRVIEVDEDSRRLIINVLNEKRNELVERSQPTDFVDDVLLDVIDAPYKRHRPRYQEVR